MKRSFLAVISTLLGTHPAFSADSPLIGDWKLSPNAASSCPSELSIEADGLAMFGSFGGDQALAVAPKYPHFRFVGKRLYVGDGKRIERYEMTGPGTMVDPHGCPFERDPSGPSKASPHP